MRRRLLELKNYVVSLNIAGNSVLERKTPSRLIKGEWTGTGTGQEGFVLTNECLPVDVAASVREEEDRRVCDVPDRSESAERLHFGRGRLA